MVDPGTVLLIPARYRQYTLRLLISDEKKVSNAHFLGMFSRPPYVPYVNNLHISCTNYQLIPNYEAWQEKDKLSTRLLGSPRTERTFGPGLRVVAIKIISHFRRT